MMQQPNHRTGQRTGQLYELTLTEARAGLRAGEFSAVELTQALLDRIAAVDASVKAFLTVTPERALAQAKIADDRRQRGDDAPLLGLPLAIKDVLSTEWRAHDLRQPYPRELRPSLHGYGRRSPGTGWHGDAG